MPVRVIASLNNETGDHCVDVFQRDDGTFGFEEFRRDHEDLRGWFSLQRYGAQIYASEAAALNDAKNLVQWLNDKIRADSEIERDV